MRMAYAVFAETSDNFQYSTRLVPENRSFTLNKQVPLLSSGRLHDERRDVNVGICSLTVLVPNEAAPKLNVQWPDCMLHLPGSHASAFLPENKNRTRTQPERQHSAS